MAVTANQSIRKKEAGGLIAFPVAQGETIYQNTIVGVISTGYLKNYTSSIANSVVILGIVADNSANPLPLATTANGSISGDNEQTSGIAGDKTVRQIWTKGRFLLTGSGFSQATVGKVVYASDNFTVSTTGVGNCPIGTCVAYISSTKIWVALNEFYASDSLGIGVIKGSLVFSSTSAGGCISVANPRGTTLLIDRMVLDITTAATKATAIDVGVAANGTTSSDILIDGADLSTAKTFDNTVNNGTNGRGVCKWESTKYVTGTLAVVSTKAVGVYAIYFRDWR